MSTEWSPQALMAMNYDAWKAWTVQAAVTLGVFTAVGRAEKKATAESLAEDLKADKRALDRLLTALAALGLVIREGDDVSLTAFSGEYLSEDSPGYFGSALSHMAQISPNWIQLARCVRQGTDAASLPPLSEEEEKKLEEARHRHFILAMYNVAALQADSVAAALDLSRAERLLDLGGGPGTYAAYFCARNPRLRAVVFDRPVSEEIALDIIGKLGVRERVSFQGGDFLRSRLPGGFDVVWLSQVLHGESRDGAALLVKKAFDSARPGGRVVIQEFVLDNDRRGPLGPALFSLNMLVQTPGGAAYSYSEIEEMLNEAGIGKIEELKGEFPPGNRIIIGYKGE
ncbi:MAG: SAM-dependent methyltransferase [Deltaproteobacteria bacterium]|jgi:SAM-dependent methyltransferase|nr:SAM-dependent methyltransferase [Deltaproteobacteria bacterium]